MEDHLHALLVDVVLVPGLAHGPLQIVIHLQELGDGVYLGVLVGALLLLGGALAVVVILRRQTQVLIVEGGELSGQGLQLLHLLLGEGEGLGGGLPAHLRRLGGLLLDLLLLQGLHGGAVLFLAHDCSSSFGGN